MKALSFLQRLFKEFAHEDQGNGSEAFEVEKIVNAIAKANEESTEDRAH